MRIAATEASAAENLLRPCSSFSKATLYTASARAVHFNDLNLAKFILGRHPGADQVIKIVGGKVLLIDETSFSSKMDEIKQEHIENSSN